MVYKAYTTYTTVHQLHRGSVHQLLPKNHAPEEGKNDPRSDPKKTRTFYE
jgi:hypothetical protein